jgi:hypothetical protein
MEILENREQWFASIVQAVQAEQADAALLVPA